MAEETIKRRERALVDKTIRLVDTESNWCGPAAGKLAKIATAHGFDKGAYKIYKSVYESISEEALGKLLCFNEAPPFAPCIIEILFWRLRERKPFQRFKLHYNHPNQVLCPDLQRLIK